MRISWRNTLYGGYTKAKHIDTIFRLAIDIGYPYFEWKGQIYWVKNTRVYVKTSHTRDQLDDKCIWVEEDGSTS